jgi:hypothetical protein
MATIVKQNYDLAAEVAELMANQPVSLLVIYRAQDGTLYLRDPIDGEWSMAAAAVAKDTATSLAAIVTAAG